jgi:hypothetical protein
MFSFALSSCDILNPDSNPNFPILIGGPADLVINISGPVSAAPGEDVAEHLIIELRNTGGELALGTIDPSGNIQEDGYMIDLVLSSDEVIPAGFANFHEVYQEDALLRGGRMSNTPDVAAGSTIFLEDSTTFIAESTPRGSYFICAQIDPGNVVLELDESNNASCFPIKIE